MYLDQQEVLYGIFLFFSVKQEFISEIKIGEGGIWKVLERDEIWVTQQVGEQMISGDTMGVPRSTLDPPEVSFLLHLKYPSSIFVRRSFNTCLFNSQES